MVVESEGMRFLLYLVMGSVVLSGNVSAEQLGTDRLISGLVKGGLKLWKNKAQKEEDKKPQEETEQPKKRTWMDRGKDMAGTFVATAVEEFKERAPHEAVALTLKDTLDVLIDEYREEYKKAGRDYARELGDLMVDRVQKDPKISRAVVSLEVFCWVMAAYLSAISVIILVCVLALKRGNRKLQEQFDALQKKFDALAEKLQAPK